jgi:zinc/manganese transport system substrate-binding protein/manganese/iron transport system substrate-binding protein
MSIRCANRTVCVATVVVAVVGTVAMLSGCSSPTPAPSGFAVVATTTQVTDFTTQIVGSAGSVTGIISANQSAHSFDPSAKVLLEMAHADALVINGLGIEPWLNGAIEASGFHGTIIDASAGIDTVANDPHVWTSVTNAEKMVATITAGLTKADPSQAKTFEKNAAAYETKLVALNAWAHNDIDQIPAKDRLLVTNHDALAYFVRDFGVTFVGSIIPSFDDNAEPSAAEIDRLVAEIKASGAKAVFSESTISPKLAQTIAAEAGVKVYSGEDALYADTLGPVGSSGQTYIDATVHNVRILVTAWGGTNIPLPKELTS